MFQLILRGYGSKTGTRTVILKYILFQNWNWDCNNKLPNYVRYTTIAAHAN